MRPRIVLAVFKKELLDTIRDRRTILATVLLPLLLYPSLFIFMGALFSGDRSRLEQQVPKIGFWGPVPPVIQEGITESAKARVTDRRQKSPGSAEAAEAIRKEDLHLIVMVPDDGKMRFEADEVIGIEIVYLQVDPLSKLTFQRAREALDRITVELRTERVVLRALPSGIADPITVKETDVATSRERGGDLAGRFLIFLLLSSVTFGAMYPAIDLTAGEKERGTMQTLLTAPVKTGEIVTAKYLLVVIVAVISAALNLLSMRIALGQGLQRARDIGEFALDPISLLKVFILLVPIAILISAVLLTIGIFARSFKEAQNYMGPVAFFVFLPGIIAMSNMELTPTTALIPLINLSLAMRDTLRAASPGPELILAYVVNAFYALAGLLLAAKVFSTEQVLLGGEKPWRDVFGKHLGRATPSGRGALLFAVLLMAGMYYAATLFPESTPLAARILIAQLFVLLIPCLVWLRLGRFDIRLALWLKAPSRWAWAGIGLLSGGLWALGSIVTRLEIAVFPGAQDYFGRLEDLTQDAVRGVAFPFVLLLIALVPAITEEIAFRGLILSGLRSTGTAASAILGSSILFGLFHADIGPYRILPAVVMGAALASAVLLSRSILAGVIPHAVNTWLPVLPWPWISRLRTSSLAHWLPDWDCSRWYLA